MISRTGYNAKKCCTPMAFARLKIWSDDYLLLSITEILLTEIILEIIDSNVKNLGEVEYDTKNCLRHQKTPVKPKNSKWGQPPIILLPLYINRSITKIFPIETVVEMIDSSVRSLGEVESIISRSVLIGNFLVRDQFSEKFEVHIATVHKSLPNKTFPN